MTRTTKFRCDGSLRTGEVVSNHRRLDVAAVVDFNAIFTPQATNIQENGKKWSPTYRTTSNDERKKLIRIDPSGSEKEIIFSLTI
jgi:hypothetical protein